MNFYFDRIKNTN